jgi:hypothetical protein
MHGLLSQEQGLEAPEKAGAILTLPEKQGYWAARTPVLMESKAGL